MTKGLVFQIVLSHKKILQRFQYVRQSIVTRIYYKNVFMLDTPWSQENITKNELSQIVHSHKKILANFIMLDSPQSR